MTNDLFRTMITPHDGAIDLWCKIPAGEHWIGGIGMSGEEPRHRIQVVRPFWIAALPVTNAQYAAFDPEHPSEGGLGHPAVGMTWEQAMAFCRWLADEEGHVGARLPTEEEWEVACRAGTETRYWSGDSESDLDAVGWYLDNAGDSIHAVGEKPANPWGLYDVHGNVWEWTASPWKANYVGQRDGLTIDPAEASLGFAEACSHRVVRGGSAWNVANRSRSAYRGQWMPDFEGGDLGFRVLLPPLATDQAGSRLR